MGKDKKPFWRELLPHAVWEAIRELVKRLPFGSAGAALIAAVVAAWEKAKHVPPDWLFIGTVFTASFLVLTVLIYVATKRSGATRSEIVSIVTELLEQKGISGDSITQLPTSTSGPADSKATGVRPVLDAEIYRISTTGKAMSDVLSLTRSLYEIKGRLHEFAIDADVLVEMYVVNTSTTKKYIRDFIGTVEIDGKEVPLVRQRDFYAWDFNHRAYEYCLTLGDDKYDHSNLEALPNLSNHINEELEAGKPIEGWVRFLVKNIDPEKLTNNRSYKLFVVDSLGNEYPILKAVPTKRPGEVTVRQIEGH
jgi:hypothetical protein